MSWVLMRTRCPDFLTLLGYFEPQLKEATAQATRAAELDRNDPWAYVALGFVAFIERRTDESVAHFQRALDLNPNFAAAHGYLGWTLSFDGQWIKPSPTRRPPFA
jgi:tetratricopeptide (TPR) repeat protein